MVYSNHPLSIFRQLQKSIQKRIPKTSSEKNVFDKLTKTYKDALKKVASKMN